ncbi:unnamed protein product [Closterium sp. NIES-53]
MDSRTREHLATFTWRPGSGLYTLTTESAQVAESGQHAAPHSSFPPTTAPLQTLHMDMWGPARVTGQGGERYYLLVVDDYTCYTMVSPLQSKVSLDLVRDLPADKLSPRTFRYVFLGFPTDATLWQFYHPGSRRVLSSQDVTFDESVYFYRLHPHRSSLVPFLFLFLVPDNPPVVPLPPTGSCSLS